MDKLNLLKSIKEFYLKGGNIIQYLRDLEKRDYNTIEDILISYDFQAGSYIKEYYKTPHFTKKYCASLASTINSLGQFNSIIEVGIGEATTLRFILKALTKLPGNIFGFDISWSRIKFAREFLNEDHINKVKLFTANLFEIPLPDNSVDIVYTSHSIEPNGGQEEAALRELYRITKKYLILLEPSYELANEDARRRMMKLGYITNLHSNIIKLKYDVIEHRLFDYIKNPLNPTGLTVIKKKGGKKSPDNHYFICPVTHTKLKEYDDSVLYSSDGLLVYPVIDGIPCLLKDNAIIATHYLTEYNKFKDSLKRSD
jgi:SAM-dependent methyltransferase